MPAFCTHYILASEEMSNLHRIAAESGFKLCENAVYIGSQGPDIFFFHRTFPWQKGKPLRAAGSAMHRAKFGDILDRFADYMKRSGFATQFISQKAMLTALFCITRQTEIATRISITCKTD